MSANALPPPRFLVKCAVAPACFIFAGTLSAFAYDSSGLTLSGSYFETYDTEFGGSVLKIGYGGTCAATVAAGASWTENQNVVIGCCPDNNVPATLEIYGTATVNGNVYTSAKTRAGLCTVDGGSWTVSGSFYLGVQEYGTLTLRNGGSLRIGDTFRVNFGSSVDVDADSTFGISIDENGSFGKNGGICIYNNIDTKTMRFADAAGLSIDATAYKSAADEIVFENLFVASTYSTLKDLNLIVAGTEFTAEDEEALNANLSGVTVLGYEDYAKSFVVDASAGTVALHLSKIPEPSAFAPIFGAATLAVAMSRRRSRREI